MHKLEAYAASTQVFEGIGVVLTLGVEDGHGIGQLLVGHMMVADDEVDALLFGIGYLVDGFDATVEDDNELHALLLGIVYTFLAYAIAFVIAVGDIVFDVGIKLQQKLIDQRYGCTPIYVVIAIHENTLLAAHGIVESVYGDVHVLHQERIDEVGKLGAEESLGCRLGGNATPNQQQGENGAHVELLTQFLSSLFLFGCRILVIPLKVHYIVLLLSIEWGPSLV